MLQMRLHWKERMVMCIAGKTVAILHGRGIVAFARREEPGKGHVYIGKERNDLARVKLLIIAFASREESEGSDANASASRAMMLQR